MQVDGMRAPLTSPHIEHTHQVRAEEFIADIDAVVRRPKRNRNLLVYIHVPFCTAKCHFCDWVVTQTTAQLRSGLQRDRRQQYVDAILKQIRYFGPVIADLGYSPVQVLWGGGTPSVLDPDQIIAICRALRDSFDLSAISSHTFEVSPETVTPERLSAMVECGVDRITMGAESFDPSELRAMGRPHTVATIGQAMTWIAEAGIQDVNLDLITGMPNQTLEGFRTTIDRLLGVDPSHVTIFTYRPTPGTVWNHQILRGYRQSTDLAFAIESHLMAAEFLRNSGYANYMVTGFQKTSRAHLPRGGAYYYASAAGDYLGLGCGGLSIMGGSRLESNTAGLDKFLADPLVFDCKQTYRDCLNENDANIWRAIYAIVFMALSTDYGLCPTRFHDLFDIEYGLFYDHPRTAAMRSYYRNCGAEFDDMEDGRVVVTEGTRAKAYITAIVEATRSHLDG
jgi:coproporphyrinogen III oxidase-like Fe-S oxidoreductase